MVDVEAALRIILHHTPDASPSAAETVPAPSSIGRICAETILAPFPVPSAPTSIKDGYALCSTSKALRRRILFHRRAGAVAAQETLPPSPSSRIDAAIYVTTGSVIPAPFDAVIQVEDVRVETEEESTFVVLPPSSSLQPGQDIRAIGSDIPMGKAVIPARAKIGAVELGLLAMLGVEQVRVYKTPRVGILSSGDELVEPFQGIRIKAGEIYDANRPMLMAAARSELGGNAAAVDLGLLRDVDDGGGFIDRAIAEGCDVLVTSGGVSMGDRDLIKPALEKRGTVHVGRLMMKPGKPFTFATVRGSRLLVFALPGNPVSSIVTFKLFVVPALRRLQGESIHDHGYMRLTCTLEDDILLDTVRPEYHRATLKQGLRAKSLGFQRSSCLTSMRGAQLLLQLRPGTPEKPHSRRGEKVEALCIAPLQSTGPTGLPFVILGGDLGEVLTSAGSFVHPTSTVHLEADNLDEGLISKTVKDIAERALCVIIVAADGQSYTMMTAYLGGFARKVPGVEEQLRSGITVRDDIVRVTDEGVLLIGLSSVKEISHKLERIRAVLDHLSGQNSIAL